MRTIARNAFALLAIFAIAWLPACTGNDLDSGNSADVILEVGTVTVPPITAAPDATGTGCILTVTDSTMNLLNKPKNAAAVTSPFNDILLETITIEYEWDSPAVTPTLPRTQNIGGSVPANGTASITFAALFLGDVDLTALGHSVNLTMTVRGRTVDGRPVQATVLGKVLSINSTCP